MVPEFNPERSNNGAKRLVTKVDQIKAISFFLLRDLNYRYADILDGRNIIKFAKSRKEKRIIKLSEHICYAIAQGIHPKTESIHGSLQTIRDRLEQNFDDLISDESVRMPDLDIFNRLPIEPDLYELAIEYLNLSTS